MKETYIKSPLNYVGGKYKLLKQIIPLFPKNIDIFVDVFGGGGNVGINVSSNKVIYNDISKEVVDLLHYLKENSTEKSLSEIKELIDRFSLSKENQEGYNNLRNYYNNENNSSIVFYTMICYAFNYQIRFNQQGKYNMPFGKNRSSFNSTLEKKFIEFCDMLHKKNFFFINKSFDKINFSVLDKNCFVYCDPPYFNSVAAYNEQNGWTEKNEKDLLDILDKLNNGGVKWALSNNLKYDNPILDKWKGKYTIHYLNGDYSNCNYHKIDRSKDIEVLITNY